MKINRLLFIMIILFLLAVTGCSGSGTVEDDSIDPPIITGIVKINDTEYEMLSGGYSWAKKQGSETTVVQTDHAGPLQMAEDYDAISIMPNEMIHIDIKENPKLQVYLWNDETPKEIKVNEKQITATEEKGQHIYEVIVTWNDDIVG